MKPPNLAPYQVGEEQAVTVSIIHTSGEGEGDGAPSETEVSSAFYRSVLDSQLRHKSA